MESCHNRHRHGARGLHPQQRAHSVHRTHIGIQTGPNNLHTPQKSNRSMVQCCIRIDQLKHGLNGFHHKGGGPPQHPSAQHPLAHAFSFLCCCYQCFNHKNKTASIMSTAYAAHVVITIGFGNKNCTTNHNHLSPLLGFHL